MANSIDGFPTHLDFLLHDSSIDFIIDPLAGIVTFSLNGAVKSFEDKKLFWYFDGLRRRVPESVEVREFVQGNF